jgi:hypothetical protein
MKKPHIHGKLLNFMFIEAVKKLKLSWITRNIGRPKVGYSGFETTLLDWYLHLQGYYLMERETV